MTPQTNMPQKVLFTRKALALLIFPLIIEQLLAVTIGMADTVMVASIGEASVSGISLVDSINILLIQIFSALATGGAVVTAQYIGREDHKNACSSAKQLLYSSTLLAVVIMVFSLVFNQLILHTIFGNIASEVMERAETYFWLSALSYPFLAIYNAGAALFRSMGNSRVSMFISLLMNLINIGGNALLIYVFQLDVAGAAIASLVSRALGACIILKMICNPVHTIHIEKLFRPEIRWGMIKSILKVGIPNGLENSMFQIGKLLVQRLIAGLGTAAIAANAIANTIASLANIPGCAIGLSMITVVGQCVGANDYKQATRYTKKLMGITIVSMGLCGIGLLIFNPFLVGIFHLSPEASKATIEVLYWFGICCILFWPPSFALPNALRAAGDARFTMWISVFSMWIFRIGFSFIFVNIFHMGLLGVWIAMIIDWVARAIIFIIRFHGEKWKDKQVIS